IRNTYDRKGQGTRHGQHDIRQGFRVAPARAAPQAPQGGFFGRALWGGDPGVLGRAIQGRLPQAFPYFSTLNFRYHGVGIHNHNSLLGHVRGVDGIKTGYTEASGYNLVTSVRREGRHIVAVVLGGRSNAARDTRMRELIEEHIGRASTGHTAPATTDVAREEGAPVAIAPVPVPVPA